VGGEELRQAVEAQADARVRGDLAAFAVHTTPQALLRLHRSGFGPRDAAARSFEVLEIEENGDSGRSDVQYRGGGTYVLRTGWERRDGVWKAIMIDMPPELVAVPWWKRLLGIGGRKGQPGPERRDLS
jgi:hypothetical protein